MGTRGFVNARINLAILRATNLPQTKSWSLIEPCDKPMSPSFPNHKNALLRFTNYNQEQPIDVDPNTILHNSLIITTKYIRSNTHRQKKTQQSNVNHFTISIILYKSRFQSQASKGEQWSARHLVWILLFRLRPELVTLFLSFSVDTFPLYQHIPLANRLLPLSIL
jgi:hypothetical protein